MASPARMPSPSPSPSPHLPYGPRATAASPTPYASSQALLPPSSNPMPLSRQSSASSMNSGDGFFKQRYGASPAVSRSGSPFEGYASGRGRGEKGLGPSMQDKVRLDFFLLQRSSLRLAHAPRRASSPSPPTQAHGAPTSPQPTQSPTTTCTTRTRNGIGNTTTAGASSPSVDS